MEYELEERICAADKCNIRFKVLTTSDQIICSQLNHGGMGGKKLKIKMKKNQESLRLGTETIKIESGMMGPGGQKRESKKDEKLKDAMIGLMPERRRKEKIEKRNITKTKNLESDSKRLKENITIGTENQKSKERLNGAEEIESTKTQSKESIMKGTKEISSQRSSNEEGKEIQQSDSTQLSTRLSQENEGSIQLLTNSAQHLIGLAESLAAPKRVDEEGNIIQRSPTHELNVAVKCLSEARNVMKTKLDYLKFGHELVKHQESKENQ